MDSLRKAFGKKFPSPCCQFDEFDVRRLHENDTLASAFLEMNEGNVENSLVQIEKSFVFRRENNLNTLKESYFPLELLEKGSVFYHNKDKNGNKILYFRIRDNVKKDPSVNSLVKLYIAYLIETEHRKDPGQQLVMLFDMTGAGLANFDADLIRFIITCFDTYFPKFLAYLLVYDMPFILNAAWKIIRNWLSDKARERVIFAKQNSISDYIERDQLWTHMGGSDDYEFVYEPPHNSDVEDDDVFSNNASSECRKRPKNSSDTDSVSSSLTQSLPTSPPTAAPSLNQTLTQSLNSKSSTFNSTNHASNHTSRPVSNHITSGPFRLIITPSDQLHFINHDDTQSLALRNPMSRPVAFKVNTTRPEDFRVRPSSGLLQPREQLDISVTLKFGAGSLKMAATARFQILAIQVSPDTERHAAIAMLKSASRESLFESRVGCFVGPKNQEQNMASSLDPIHKEIDVLKKNQNQMMEKLDSIYFLLRILCGLAAALIFLHTMGFRIRSETPMCQPP